MKTFQTIDPCNLVDVTGGFGGGGVKLPVSHFKLPPNTAGQIIGLTPGSEGGSAFHLPVSHFKLPPNTAGRIIGLTPGSEGGSHVPVR